MARTASQKRIVEHCWILVGQHRSPFWHARRMRPTRGQVSSVEFDAAWVLAREESRGDIVGFYHTHPGGPPAPSLRDDRTMHAWVSALGKPLLCLIESEGKPAAFRYDGDEAPAVRLGACRSFPRSVVVAYETEPD